MYKPKFNSLLVAIDDKDAEWGSGNDESMLGKSYSRGRVIAVADEIFPTADRPGFDPSRELVGLIGKDVIWNEGDEAGTTFEDGGTLYGLIYWYSIRAVKDEQQAG